MANRTRWTEEQYQAHLAQKRRKILDEGIGIDRTNQTVNTDQSKQRTKKAKKTTPKEQINEAKRQIAEDKKQKFISLCMDYGLKAPIPEYYFAKPDRNWRNDFYFEENGVKIGLEVEGGAWTRGRHTRGKGFIEDINKYNSMAARNIWLLRCVPDDLLKEKTILMIKNKIYPNL